MQPISQIALAAIMGVSLSNAHPIAPGGPSNSDISNSNFGPIPGESNYYNDYRGVAAPFPANDSSAIPAVSNGSAGPDDLLFQNLLSAEWAIYSFYQQGVEAFTADDFTDAGYPNTTYDRIQEIRDNEAGHLRIFQDQISNSSLKPGSCKYDYGFHDVTTYLAIQTVLEISSMAFLTGLVLEAQTNASKGALLAIAETETRHEAWSLIDIWKANPFGGPSDTAFPYANQILDFTNVFIIPDSCPAQNPTYPYPRQNLPQISYNPNTTTLLPGSDITFIYKNATNVPAFSADQDYYAVFFHGLDTISVPYNLTSNSSVIPSEFEQKGLIIAVIADEVDAPTEDSVVAGPLFIMEQVVQVNSLD